MKIFALSLMLLSNVANAGLFGPSGAEADHEWEVLKAVADDLHPKFTYVTDQEMWGVPHFAEPGITGDEPFAGDCEEFMVAAFNQANKRGLMTAPRHVKVNGEGHVITCGKYWCVDNMHRSPFLKSP